MIQSLNFRLSDSMPAAVIERWKTELDWCQQDEALPAPWNSDVASKTTSMQVTGNVGCADQTSRS